MIAATFLLCAGGGAAAQKVDISSQLRGLNMPEGLQQFLGAMVAKMQGLEEDNAVLQNKTNAVEAELRNKTLVEEELRGEISWLKKNLRHINARLDQREANSFTQVVERRQMQDSGDTVIGDAQPVQIFKRAVTFSHLSGRVDESNGMHRLLAEGGGVVIGCSSDEISQQLTVINDKCCDEPEELCAGGKVQTCNAGCAALIMPLWTSCRAQLGRAANILHDAAALCSPAAAHRFLAMCPPNAPNEDCIPICDENTHGYLLLLSIDGTDTILTCELSDSLYDWLGTSALGGFVGENVGAFLPAVISGAAGAYILKLMEPANIVTDLTIQPSQKVVVSGDQTLQQPPSWGSGKFTVSALASLSLSYLRVDAVIQTLPGALSLQLDSCLLAFEGALWASETTFKNQVFNSGLVIPTGASVNISGSSLTFAANVTQMFTIESGGTLSMDQSILTTRRPSDADVYVMTIDAGGSLTVSSSQLIHADGSADPFPCDGTLPDCANEHGGPVSVIGPSVLGMVAPLVCDVETGECQSDLCLVVGLVTDCGVGGTCISPGTCTCNKGYSGDRCETHTCCGYPQPLCPCPRGCPGRGPGYVPYCDLHHPGWDAQCDRLC
eukprot:SAG31_NODE_1021_length_10327_cov_17.940653_2_plen_610_part_00